MSRQVGKGMKQACQQSLNAGVHQSPIILPAINGLKEFTIFKPSEKYKNIYRAGILYLAGAWLLVQTIMSLTPVFDWPPIFGFGIIFMLIPGYPIVMLMTWAYDATHKDSGWDKAEDARRASGKTGKGFEVTLAIMLGLAMAVVLLDIFLLPDYDMPPQEPASASQSQ